MKIFKLFLAATIALCITACSSDDDAPVKEFNAANIAGTYELTFFEGTEEYATIASDGSAVVTETETSIGDTFGTALFTFNTDGTYTTSGAYRIVYVSTITGQEPQTNTEIIQLDNEAGVYSINTANRTLIFDEEDVNDVTLFNGTDLYLTSTQVATFNGIRETFMSNIRLVKQN